MRVRGRVQGAVRSGTRGHLPIQRRLPQGAWTSWALKINGFWDAAAEAIS